MTAPQLLRDVSRCAGKTAGTLVHSQCQHCLRRNTGGIGRIVHFLPPVFVAGVCPLRRQS